MKDKAKRLKDRWNRGRSRIDRLGAVVGLMLTILLCVAPISVANAVKLWPVSVARDGFTAAQAEQVLQDFSPLKLAATGNQTLFTYLNMAQFFPHHTVPRTGRIRELASLPHPGIGSLRVRTRLGDLSLDELIDHPASRLQGIAVSRGGKLLYERYPGMRADDSHLWWSVAKVLSGLIVDQLIEEERVDPQQSLAHYLPAFADSDWSRVSVDNALQMASGIEALDSPVAYANPFSQIGRLIYAEGILAAPLVWPVTHNEALMRMTVGDVEPGVRREYSSANTNMLGLLIERVTGQPLAVAIQSRIWSKMGAEGDGLLGLSPQGNAIAHGMYSSRLRDLVRFGMLFTPSGLASGVVSPTMLAALQSGDSSHYAQDSSNSSALHTQSRVGERPVNARSQWDAVFADGDLYKSGFDGQVLYVSPARDLVIAMFATSKDRSAYAYLRPLAKMLGSEVAEFVRPTILDPRDQVAMRLRP